MSVIQQTKKIVQIFALLFLSSSYILIVVWSCHVFRRGYVYQSEMQ